MIPPHNFTVSFGQVTFTALVPAALSGALTARMVAKINGSLRTFTYPAPLAQAP